MTLAAVAGTALASTTFLSAALPIRGALFAVPLTAVVYAAFVGGLRVGLVAAALAAAYAVMHYLALDAIFPAYADRVTLASSVVGITFLIAAITGHLSDKAKRALAKEHEIAAALRAANRSLTDANKTLEAFTYLVSHDLKEPVRAMTATHRALIEDFGADERVPAEARELLTQAQEASARLERMLRALLDLSRAAQLDPADLAMVHVAEAIRSDECRALYERAQQERGATLEVEVPPNVAVVGHRAALSQVFGNLIGNAVRHSTHRSPTVRVRAAYADRRGVEIVVEDDGAGFPQAVVEAFERGSLSPARRGSGFGLAIARRAVESMGGTMWLGASEDLGGAAVHVRLALDATAVASPAGERISSTVHAVD